MSDSGTVRRLVQPNRRILIVDDNRAIHEDFHKILGGATAERNELDALHEELFGGGGNGGAAPPSRGAIRARLGVSRR